MLLLPASIVIKQKILDTKALMQSPILFRQASSKKRCERSSSIQLISLVITPCQAKVGCRGGGATCEYNCAFLLLQKKEVRFYSCD